MASFSSLLADELGVSDDQAQTLLTAMLREVRKQARDRRVHLPRLGTFRADDGRLTFDPDDGLARAVNEEYEGLEAEELPAPSTEPAPPSETAEGPDDTTTDEPEPSGAERDQDWSPFEREPTGTDDEEEDAAADTEEFQVPSEPSASDPSASRSAASTSDPGASSDAASPSDADPEPDTEEFYPLVEDDDEEDGFSSQQTTEEADEEHESLSGIWDEPEDADESGSGSGVDWPTEAEKQSSHEASPDSAEKTSSASSPSAPAPPDEQTATREEEAPSPSPNEGASTAARVVVGAVVVLLLGGAAWYLLGQRGLVPSPQSTFAKLQARVAGAPTQSPSQSPDQASPTSDAQPAPSAADAADDPASTTAPSDQQGRNTESDTPSGTDGIDSARGGWALVVASRSERAPAEELAATYRDRLADTGLPVDVVVGQVDGTTRYRVGVGQFDSRGAAQQAIEQHQNQLPEGAWPLRLQ